MPRYDHLQLVRFQERLPRRKTGGGRSPQRDPAGHGRRLGAELEQVVAAQRGRRRADYVDPSLILRVRMSGATLEEEWNRVGLTLLSTDEDRSLILFSSNEELGGFRSKLAAYAAGVQEGQANPAFAGFIANVESIAEVAPRDRIGMRAREGGLVEAEDFQPGTTYVVDVEVWDIGRRDVRDRKVDDIVRYGESRGADELDRHVGPNLTLVRLRCDGGVVRTLLTIGEVAEIDFPAQPDVSAAQFVDMALDNLPDPTPVDPDAPVVGIIDSGVNDHPLIDGTIVGSIAVPASLGTADEHGHGTFVAGVTTFGDLRSQLAGGVLARRVRLCSAKVIDDRGRFPENRLTARVMREAITRLNAEFGCRIFVIALGDRLKVIQGGKVGPWAQTLDELVRELDVVIVVAAGNRSPRRDLRVEEAVTEYPRYLMEVENRLCEPAGAMNVVTVGSVAHGDGVGPRAGANVGVRAITEAFEPSPFSRAGPGVRGAIKPDFVDVGGTLVYDGPTASLHGGEVRPEAGVMSLHHRPVDRLFAARSGTSFAAPLVAHKASQILARFPGSSANLVRALLVGAADVPEESFRRLTALGEAARTALCGHGRIDADRASYSDDARVVLVAEDELAIDHFAVYQVPVPRVFQTERGRRTIRVSLAFDPPVRHTRADYNGVSMGFRLIRGCDVDAVFEFYRRRTKAEGPVPEFKFDRSLSPGPRARERSSLQSASRTFSRDVSAHGDVYYLVVTCSGGWAGEEGQQRYAVSVEISHEAEIALYERIRERVRVRV